MRTSLLLASFLTCALSFSTASVQAAALGAGTYTDGDKAPNPTPSTGKIVLTGKITNPAGPLPGAVVILTSTNAMAVTNADGEFEFVVPANAGALQARVTYAGYADEQLTLNASAGESTVNLTDARVIVVSRKQQLKKYLKTAKKQIEHDLKQIHK